MRGMFIVGIVIWLAIGIGWFANIMTLVNHINDPVTSMTILRAAGIVVAPLGAILGYL